MGKRMAAAGNQKDVLVVTSMEDFENKVKITEDDEGMEIENNCRKEDSNAKTLHLLRKFLDVQQRRAQAYAKLRNGFSEYMVSGGDSTYQQLCSEITVEFNDCSKQVCEIESQFLSSDCFRDDLAHLLRAVQEQEKQKLQLAQGVVDSSISQPDIGVLRTLMHELTQTTCLDIGFNHCQNSGFEEGWTALERLVTHENCRFEKPKQHLCVHLHEITEAAGTQEAEEDAEYNNALKVAIKGVQDAVTSINDHLEEIRYEIAALEAE